MAEQAESFDLHKERQVRGSAPQGVELEDGNTVKEEQMELACDLNSSTELGTSTEISLEEDELEDAIPGEADSSEASEGSEAENAKWLALDPAGPRGEAWGRGRGTPGIAVPPAGSCRRAAGRVASDVTELGSVRIIEDPYLGAPIKEEVAEEAFLGGEDAGGTSGLPPGSAAKPGAPRPPGGDAQDSALTSGSLLSEQKHPSPCAQSWRPAVAENNTENCSGTSAFELLKAQLLGAKASDTADATEGTKHRPMGDGGASNDCKVCGKSFSRLETLQLHQLLHKLDAMYDCAVCGRGLDAGPCGREGGHSGHGQYQCVDCGKNFSHPRSLSRHRRVHRAEGVYGCS
nr:PREDICTED: zinc finger protein 696-like [Lepisosteus oculatus]